MIKFSMFDMCIIFRTGHIASCLVVPRLHHVMKKVLQVFVSTSDTRLCLVIGLDAKYQL